MLKFYLIHMKINKTILQSPFIQRALVLAWLVALLPFATIGRVVTFGLYVLMSVLAICYAIIPKTIILRLLILIFAFIVISFALPLDIMFVQGQKFGIAWSEVSKLNVDANELTADGWNRIGRATRHREAMFTVRVHWIIIVWIPDVSKDGGQNSMQIKNKYP